MQVLSEALAVLWFFGRQVDSREGARVHLKHGRGKEPQLKDAAGGRRSITAFTSYAHQSFAFY